MKIQVHRASGHGTKAFTIAEVVVATVIIGIGAAGLMGCFGCSFLVMQMARENQRATQIILEAAETIRLYNWDEVVANGIPSTFTATYDPTATNGSQGAVYTGTCTLSPVPFGTSYSGDMRQLTVTLQWHTRNIARSRTMTTLIAKDGIQNYVY